MPSNDSKMHRIHYKISDLSERFDAYIYCIESLQELHYNVLATGRHCSELSTDINYAKDCQLREVVAWVWEGIRRKR